MIRKYGNEPFKIAIVHGGPGACGSVACIGKKLSKSFGVIEPIQTKYSIPDLIDELHKQVDSSTNKPITILGHSWGAWLVILFAAKYPELVKQIILVGSGPFKNEYVGQIMQRRLNRLSKSDAELFQHFLSQLKNNSIANKDEILEKLGALAEKSDSYDILDVQDNEIESLPIDGQMYSSIWPQAVNMRSNGTLAHALNELKCPVVVIHGEYDSHPVEGVVDPLNDSGVTFETYILPKCGHEPFREKFAYENFYQIVIEIIQR
ncbi:MAG: alpha/beta hydrolase [Defluviitaleaceae bacterium]|nr:alpha/beta hydrolase [Defluviitaleaceae bacterium]